MSHEHHSSMTNHKNKETQENLCVSVRKNELSLTTDYDFSLYMKWLWLKWIVVVLPYVLIWPPSHHHHFESRSCTCCSRPKVAGESRIFVHNLIIQVSRMVYGRSCRDGDISILKDHQMKSKQKNLSSSQLSFFTHKVLLIAKVIPNWPPWSELFCSILLTVQLREMSMTVVFDHQKYWWLTFSWWKKSAPASLLYSIP